MGIVLHTIAHEPHHGLYAKAVGGLEQRIHAAYDNWKAQRDAWRAFHVTSVGRHVSRRAWMRHGAMLETLCHRHD